MTDVPFKRRICHALIQTSVHGQNAVLTLYFTPKGFKFVGVYRAAADKDPIAFSPPVVDDLGFRISGPQVKIPAALSLGGIRRLADLFDIRDEPISALFIPQQRKRRRSIAFAAQRIAHSEINQMGNIPNAEQAGKSDKRFLLEKCKHLAAS